MIQKPFASYSKYRSGDEYRVYQAKTKGVKTTIQTPTGTETVIVKQIDANSPESLNRVKEANEKASTQKAQISGSNAVTQQSRANGQYEQVQQAINRQSVDSQAVQRNSPVPDYYVHDELARQSRPLYQKEVSQGGSAQSNPNPTDRYAPVKVYKQTPSGSEVVGVADWRDVKTEKDLNSSNDKLGGNGINNNTKNNSMGDGSLGNNSYGNSTERNRFNDFHSVDNNGNLVQFKEKTVLQTAQERYDQGVDYRLSQADTNLKYFGTNILAGASYPFFHPIETTTGIFDFFTGELRKDIINNEPRGTNFRRSGINLVQSTLKDPLGNTGQFLGQTLTFKAIDVTTGKSSPSLRAIEKEIAKAEKGKVELKGEYEIQPSGTFRDNVYMEGAKVKTSTITPREETIYGVLETNKLDVVDVVTDSTFQRNFMLKNKPASTKIQVSQDFATGDITVVKMNKGKVVYEKTTKGKVPEQPKVTRQTPMINEQEFVAGEKGIRTETQITPFETNLPKGYLRGFEKSQVRQEAKVMKPQRNIDFGVNIKDTGEIKNPQTAKRNTKTYIEFTKDILDVKKDNIKYDSPQSSNIVNSQAVDFGVEPKGTTTIGKYDKPFNYKVTNEPVKTSELRQARGKTTNVQSNQLKAFYSNKGEGNLKKLEVPEKNVPYSKWRDINLLTGQITKYDSTGKPYVTNEKISNNELMSIVDEKVKSLSTGKESKQVQVLQQQSENVVKIQAEKAPLSNTANKLSQGISSMETSSSKIGSSNKFKLNPVVNQQQQATVNIQQNKPDIYQGTETSSISKPLQINISSQIQTPEQVSSQVQIPEQISDQVQTPSQIQTPEQITSPIQTPIQVPEQIQTPSQIQTPEQTQIQKNIQITKPIQMTTLRPKTISNIRMMKTPKIPLKFPSSSKSTPGYNVFVKEKGQLKKINIKPMSSEDAIKKGMFVVGTTARASFKITPANAPAQEKFQGGQVYTNDFYKSKSGFMVEKASRRIKSSGELQEITFKGIATNKVRQGFKSMFSKNKSIFGGRRK